MPNSSSAINLYRLVFKLLKENQLFFGCFLLFFVLGGVTLFYINKGDLLLWFSDHRIPFTDLFFKYFTRVGEEWAYVAWMLVFLFLKRPKVVFLIPIAGILVTIISFLSKNFFLQPRPSEYYKTLGILKEIPLVEGVHLVKGFSSFPSGHTMSAFALFSLIAFYINNKKWANILLFLAAFTVGLSRVYLVQHFLKDIYLGAIMGLAIAMILYIIQKRSFNSP